MPYDKIDPAAWWAGAEAAPPMPDGEGPWTLVGTAYGWAWGRPEPDGFDTDALRTFLAPAKPGTCRIVQTPDGLELRSEGGGSVPIVGGEPFAVSPLGPVGPSGRPGPKGSLAPPACAPAEVRVGDRVRCPSIGDATVVGRDGDYFRLWYEGNMRQYLWPVSDLGPAGSGKPWTLLSPRMTQTTVETDSGTVTTITATHTVRDTPAIPPERARVAVLGDAELAPDADTAGILREGMRALGRIEAQAAQQVHAGGGEASVRHEPAPAGPDAAMRERVRAFSDAYRAAPGCHDDSILPGLRAAVAVTDPRREAERRVVEAARAIGLCQWFGREPAGFAELRDALGTLAALDAKVVP